MNSARVRKLTIKNEAKNFLEEEWDVMVDLFFYKKIEDVEAQAIEDKAEADKAAGREEKTWDRPQEEEAAAGEEEWAA